PRSSRASCGFARRQALKPEVFDVGQRVRAIATSQRPSSGPRSSRASCGFARRQALKPEVFDVGQRVRAIAT
ncbi:hypothetical protein CTI14_71120, partial [Methylobacterium radiotolerans]